MPEIAQIIPRRCSKRARQLRIERVVRRANDKMRSIAPEADIRGHPCLSAGEVGDVSAHIVKQDAENVGADGIDLQDFRAQRHPRVGIIVSVDLKRRKSGPK